MKDNSKTNHKFQKAQRYFDLSTKIELVDIVADNDISAFDKLIGELGYVKNTKPGGSFALSLIQKFIIASGGIALLLTAIFPPIKDFIFPNNYQLIFTTSNHVDIARLFLEWLIIFVVAGLALLLFQEK